MDRRYPAQPIVGVGVVVLKDEHVLLIQRAKPPGMGRWSLPGGAQNLGETVNEAGRREIHEETGVEIEIGGLVEVVDSIERKADGRVLYHYTLVDLWGFWRSGEARAGDDAGAVAWVKFDEIQRLGLWPATERVIRKAIILANDRSKNKKP